MFIILKTQQGSLLTQLNKTIRINGFTTTLDFDWQPADNSIKKNITLQAEFIKYRLGTKVRKVTTRRRQRRTRTVGFRQQYSIFRIVQTEKIKDQTVLEEVKSKAKTVQTKTGTVTKDKKTSKKSTTDKNTSETEVKKKTKK